MTLPLSTTPYVHCGADIKLRSFRLAPSYCTQCGKMTPDGAGCLVFALAVAIPFGLVGAGIGWLLNPLVNIRGFVAISTLVAVVDGFGVATVWYWRSTHRAREFGPWA